VPEDTETSETTSLVARVRQHSLVRAGLTALSEFRDEGGPLLSTALAYYAIFAMAPLLVLALALARALLGQAAATGQVADSLSLYVGNQLATVVQNLIGEIESSSATSTASIIGAAVFLYAGVSLFLRLQLAFNMMWGVRVRAGEHSRSLILARLRVFALLFAPGVLLVVAFLAGSVVSWLSGLLGETAPGYLVGLAQRSIPLAVTWLIFAVLFKVLPDVIVSWRALWFGALVTAVGWTLGNWGFGVYLKFSSRSFYGLVGTVVMVLLWAHYMALIALAGTKLCKTTHVLRGHPVTPKSYAMRVQTTEIEG
jgi:membrane protein